MCLEFPMGKNKTSLLKAMASHLIGDLLWQFFTTGSGSKEELALPKNIMFVNIGVKRIVSIQECNPVTFTHFYSLKVYAN